MTTTFLAVGTTLNNLAEVKAPDSFEWSLQDVSTSDAGRTQDASATMHKNRFAQKRKISLSWSNPSGAVATQLLQAFNPEYVYVRYYDPLDGALAVRRFYVGDRKAPLRWYKVGGVVHSSVDFDIIEQ